MKNKLILLTLIIILLVGALVWFICNKTIYSYKNMYGTYTFEKNIKEMHDKATYRLILNKNGTFKYSSSTIADSGYIGNYIIEDNKIKLNYMFKHGSDVSLNVVSGRKELLISGNRIIDNKPVDFDKKTKKIELKKSKTSELFDFYEMVKTVAEFDGINVGNSK